MGPIVMQASRPAGASVCGALAHLLPLQKLQLQAWGRLHTCAVLWEVLDSMMSCGGVRVGGEGFEAEKQAELPIAEKATEGRAWRMTASVLPPRPIPLNLIRCRLLRYVLLSQTIFLCLIARYPRISVAVMMHCIEDTGAHHPLTMLACDGGQSFALFMLALLRQSTSISCLWGR